MSATTSALYGGRWGVFLVRYALYAGYGFLQFFGKPGSRLIVPVAAMGLAWWQRDELEALLWHIRLPDDWQAVSSVWYGVVAVFAACLLAFINSYKHRISWKLYLLRKYTALLLRLVFMVAVVIGALVLLAQTFPDQPLARILHPWVKQAVAESAALSAGDYRPWLDWHRLPLQHAALAAVVLAACAAYTSLSKLLTLLLGAFPPMVRPLPPMKRLRPANRVLRPARVKIVVPPLPGLHGARHG